MARASTPRYLSVLRDPDASLEHLRAALPEADAELSRLEGDAQAARERACAGDSYDQAETTARALASEIDTARFRRDTLAGRLEAAETAREEREQAARVAACQRHGVDLAQTSQDIGTRVASFAEELVSAFRAFEGLVEASTTLRDRVREHVQVAAQLGITPALERVQIVDWGAVGAELERHGAPSELVKLIDPEGLKSRAENRQLDRHARAERYRRAARQIEIARDELQKLNTLPRELLSRVLGISPDTRDARIALMRSNIAEAEAIMAELADAAPKAPKAPPQPPRAPNCVDGDARTMSERYAPWVPIRQTSDLRGPEPTRIEPMFQDDPEWIKEAVRTGSMLPR